MSNPLTKEQRRLGALSVAFDHIEWATRNGMSYEQIADSVGRPMQPVTLERLSHLLASVWLINLLPAYLDWEVEKIIDQTVKEAA